MKENKFIVQLMADAFTKVAAYTENMSYQDFAADSKTQSAVIMQLQVIGELAKRVPEDIKQMIVIPWKNMSGLRDLVAHNYFNLDLVSIWETATESAPPVAEQIKKYLVNNL